MTTPIDFAKETNDALSAKLTEYEVFGNNLLVAPYVRKASKGGIILADISKEEDATQAKAGLVLKKGPGCFANTDNWDFYDQSVEVGDWVSFRPFDGIRQKIGDIYVLILKDISVKSKVGTTIVEDLIQ